MKPLDLCRVAIKSGHVSFMSEVIVMLSASPENAHLVESLHRAIERVQTENLAASKFRMICEAGEDGA